MLADSGVLEDGAWSRSARSGTHYEVLGIAPNATDAEIRKAYRSRVRECHPDKLASAAAAAAAAGGSESESSKEATARLENIRKARDVLSSPLQRCEYDYLMGVIEMRQFQGCIVPLRAEREAEAERRARHDARKAEKNWEEWKEREARRARGGEEEKKKKKKGRYSDETRDRVQEKFKVWEAERRARHEARKAENESGAREGEEAPVAERTETAFGLTRPKVTSFLMRHKWYITIATTVVLVGIAFVL